MTVLLIVILISLPLIVFGATRLSNAASKADEERAARHAAKVALLSHIPGLNPAVVYEGPLSPYALAIDPASEQFAFASYGATPRHYHFNQLAAIEVERNGSTITTTKGKVDTSGAGVATLLAGPVGGLLAGAKTKSTSTSIETVELTLKVYVTDLHTPCFAIPFGGGTNDMAGADRNLSRAVAELDAWHGRFRAILAANEGKRHIDTSALAIVHDAPSSVASATNLSWSARVFG